MKTQEIEKCIKLLNDAKIDDLRAFLTYQRQISIMSEKQADTKQITAITKTLKATTNSRPQLNSCQHTPDGLQFICDGYFAILWKDNCEMLDGLQQLDASQSIKFDGIWNLCDTEKTTATADEILLIENAKRFAKLYGKKGDTACLRLFGKIFKADYISDLYDMIFKYIDLKTAKVYRKQGSTTPTLIETDEVKIILLPCRVENGLETVINDRQAEFLNELKRGC